MPATPAAPPDLNIPHSQNTVEVFIIDTTSHVANIPVPRFMTPAVPGYDLLDCPCYAFLIKRKNSAQPNKYDNIVFDLGIRADWETGGPPAVPKRLKDAGYDIKAEKHVVDVLREHGDDPASIGGVIWSHYHFDHTGDPSTFPNTTDLIVGPGFKSRFVPGWPTKQDSPIDENAWKNRTLREIDFAAEGNGLRLGEYEALDFYGDGSFYLLNTPGHATGHICGLARTGADPPEFIYMGGDIAHHGGEFRPTKYLPLPEDVQPNPLVAPYSQNAPTCPGSMFEAIHPTNSSTEPFFQPNGPIHDDAESAVASLNKMHPFDASPNVFTIIAHDTSLYDIVDFYPRPANAWKQKVWNEQGRWRFLRDFNTKAKASLSK